MRRLAGAAFAVSGIDDDVGNDKIGTAPSRPSLPIISFLAFGIWSGCAACMTVCVDLATEPRWVLAIVGLVGAIGLLLLLWKRRRSVYAFVFVIGLLLGISLASVSLGLWETNIAKADGVSAHWECVALGDGQQGSYGQTVLAEASSAGETFRVRVQLGSDEQTVHYGDSFSVWGSIKPPGETQRAAFSRSAAVGSLRAYNVEYADRVSVIGAISLVRNKAIAFLEPFSGRDGGLVAAVVCGWRGDLDEEVYRNFQVSGLAHIVAVSGAHLSLVAAFVACVLRMMKSPRWLSCAFQMLFIVAYLVFTAMPASAIRAALMTVAGLNAWTLRRRPSSLNALSVCIIAMIALDPTTSVSVSFALSSLSTLGIVVFGKLFSSWVEELFPGCPSFISDAVSLTFASSVVASPLSAAMFSQFPVVSVLSNILTGPLFAPVCVLGLAATSVGLLFPGLSLICGNAASWAGWLMVRVVGFTSSIPWASIPVDVPEFVAIVASALLCAILWVVWPKPHRVSLLSAFAFVAPLIIVVGACILLRPQATEIAMLDVGQGDAIVLRSGSSTLLIDTGNQEAKLREALARQGIYKIDAVLITHPDDDHMGSLASLNGVVEVSSVIIADGAKTCGCSNCAKLRKNAQELVGQDSIVSLSAQDVIRVGKWEARCVWPREFTDEGGNADSICLVATADIDGDGSSDAKALLVGDAETDQLQTLIDEGEVGQVDIYKVGHHGSKNALTEEQARILSPKLSLVSVGANNRYGHPNAKTVNALEGCGSSILRTDQSGDVVCEIEAGGVRARSVR